MSKQQTKPVFNMAAVAQKLFTIRNIANLAADYPENKAEAYVLQNVTNHIAEMIQDLLEAVEEVA
jgi:intracellular sulfur oxidation DsrE/DsrF family protein